MTENSKHNEGKADAPIRVLLAGCGRLGMALGAALSQPENAFRYQVTGLKRSPADAEFTVINADLLQPQSLQAMDDEPFDYVVYTATPSERSDAGYEAAYVTGLRNLMAAIPPPRQRLLLVSSTGVYHQDQGEWVDEDSPTQPQRFSGTRLLEGEQLALATWPNTTVIRFAGIYGPERWWLLRRVLDNPVVNEQHPKYTNRIHLKDCVGVLHFLLERHLSGQALDSIYIGCDDDPAPEFAVLDFIAEAMNAERPLRDKGATGDDVIKQNKRCRNRRLKALGYEFNYPTYREGYREIVADYLVQHR